MLGNGDDDDRVQQYIKSVKFWLKRAVIEKESN